MGKIKQKLEEDMMLNPDLYNGYAEYDFESWVQCRLEENLERDNPIRIIKKTKKKEIQK